MISKVSEFLTGTFSLMSGLLGVAVFAELLFGKFLGSFSVIQNLIDVVAKFGNNGFVGLLAMLLILGFVNKDKK
jgi:hypothetical protein